MNEQSYPQMPQVTLPSSTPQSEVTAPQPSSHRTLLIAVCFIIFFGVLIFLIYHNGKSIYDNGI